MIEIGPYKLKGFAVLAPMAGITDYPFRRLCKETGASAVTAEMSSDKKELRGTFKSKTRITNPNDSEPRIIQIVGTEPTRMAEAAIYHVQNGAQIIDINMGCPAKKVCNKLAGSALMKDPKKIEDILKTVIRSVDVPVTLKMRTGWDPKKRNAREIALLAEYLGVKSIAIHGRTRACRFQGDAEYDTISNVVEAVSIPVFANGDINSAEKAKMILKNTNASGVMIGRGAQGRPWIFNEINNLSDEGSKNNCIYNIQSHGEKAIQAQQKVILTHLDYIHDYYSSFCESCNSEVKMRRNGHKYIDLGVRISRKHICRYFIQMVEWKKYRSLFDAPHTQHNTEYALKEYIKRIEIAQKQFNRLVSYKDQKSFLIKLFGYINKTGDIAA